MEPQDKTGDNGHKSSQMDREQGNRNKGKSHPTVTRPPASPKTVTFN